jgi:hypothetical protein
MNHPVNKKLLDQLRKVLKEKKDFPFGILAYFGPDNNTVTKIVAVVVEELEDEPIIKSWMKPDVTEDPGVASEIGKFFLEWNIKDIIMTDGVLGCPHEEGIDFPVGGECPHCPYWARHKQ